MRLRQVALVARNLAPVEQQLCKLFGLETAFRDPGVAKYGLENAVIPVGDTFLEVVAPVEEGTTAGRFLDRRNGDGGYMVLVQADDIADERRHVASLGIRVVDEINLDDAWGTHLHPKDVPGAILSIDAMEPPAEWRWAGPGWRDAVHTEVATGIVGVTIQSLTPHILAQRWAEVLRSPFETSGDSATVQLDDAAVRFTPPSDARGDGISGIDIAVREPIALVARARDMKLQATEDTIDAAGVRFRLVRGGGA